MACSACSVRTILDQYPAHVDVIGIVWHKYFAIWIDPNLSTTHISVSTAATYVKDVKAHLRSPTESCCLNKADKFIWALLPHHDIVTEGGLRAVYSHWYSHGAHSLSVIQVNTSIIIEVAAKHSPNAGVMLGHRLWRWPSITQALG